MSSNVPLCGLFFALPLISAASAQTPNCAPPSNQQLIIYRAGSLTRALRSDSKTPTLLVFARIFDLDCAVSHSMSL
jgi:hypothetical protein